MSLSIPSDHGQIWLDASRRGWGPVGCRDISALEEQIAICERAASGTTGEPGTVSALGRNRRAAVLDGAVENKTSEAPAAGSHATGRNAAANMSGSIKR